MQTTLDWILMQVVNIPEEDIPGASQAVYNHQGWAKGTMVKTITPLTGQWLKEWLGSTWFWVANLEEPHLLKKVIYAKPETLAGVLKVLGEEGLLVEHKEEETVPSLFGK